MCLVNGKCTTERKIISFMWNKMWNLGLHDFIRDYDLIEYGAVVIAFVQCCGCFLVDIGVHFG